MRTLPVLAISLAVHAAVLAWVVAYTPDREPPAPEAPPVVVEVIDKPIEVAILDGEKIGSEHDFPASREKGSDPISRRSSATGPRAAATQEKGSDPISRSPYMEMRRPAAPRVVLPTKMEWDPDMPAEAPPPVVAETGKLQPGGNGTYRSEQGPFVAKVDRDGNVKLQDGKNLRVHIALPSPKQLGRIIADWYLDPNKPVGTLPPDHVETEPVLNANESSGADKKKDHGDVATVPILSGGFDISDAFMRRHGQDPYASKKLAFLDSTRDERVQIGMRHRSEQLAMAPQIMKKNLERLWATVADPAERKQALFELWDEIEETGSEEVVAAGEQARMFVVGWIRVKLPEGSALAYTDAELAALNAHRTSKALFAPY